MKREDANQMSFWEHLDVLRAALIKMLLATVACAVGAFCFKEELFAVVLAPRNSDFVTYRLLFRLAGLVTETDMEAFNVQLINTGLAQQFLIHAQTAIYAGVLCASPYILYQLFRFVSPALYVNERRYAFGVIGWGYTLFVVGVLVSYFLVFPLTFRFLGTYQVSGEVTNMISLQSYIDTLLTLSLSLGIVFEIPILSWLFAKLGFLNATFMRSYRRHAIVIILIVAAIITPTTDAITLCVVALPMWLLYEASILVVARTRAKSNEV